MEEPKNFQPTSLKRDVVTRWFSLLAMVSSFSGQVKIVNRWLGYLNRPDLIITPVEEMAIPFIVQYFEAFTIVTKILEADTPTINLAVILLGELKTKLDEQKHQLSMIFADEALWPFLCEIKQMYETTLDHIDSRYVLTDEMLVGALLDPMFQHCDYVTTLLTKRHKTKKQLLSEMYRKYVGPLPEHRSAPLAKKSSVRNQLAQRLGLVSSTNTFDGEVDTFGTVVADNVDNLLDWWATIGVAQFPLLAKLARVILQLSATAATVERLNSKAGKIITPGRASLTSAKCNKIMLVHYNYPMISKLTQN